MLPLLTLFLACTGKDPAPPGTMTDDTAATTTTPSDDTGTTTDTLPEPLERVDVVVIGGGASGLSAAWEVLNAGATVRVLERDSGLGGAGGSASNFFAAGTRWQADAGVEDSPEIALKEWEDFTQGDASNPHVTHFMEHTAETLDWLEELGCVFTRLSQEPGAGSLARIHTLDGVNYPFPVDVMEETLGEFALLETPGIALVERGGAVVGVEIEGGWIEASAVVVATGGFARSEARVKESIPQLLDFPYLSEAWPAMDGTGLDMIEGVGGALSNMENLGLYAHGVLDGNIGEPEVMILIPLAGNLVVGTAGERIMNEEELQDVWVGHYALEHGQLYTILDETTWLAKTMKGLGFNYPFGADNTLTPEEYAEKVPVASAESMTDLASQIGVDGTNLAATVERYNQLVVDGTDLDFGKDLMGETEIVSPPYRALPLAISAGKSFGGASLGDDAEVLDINGQPIPGLYAAGEVAGFLGGTWVGRGFSGSVTAAYYMGRVAGKAAAAHAVAR